MQLHPVKAELAPVLLLGESAGLLELAPRDLKDLPRASDEDDTLAAFGLLVEELPAGLEPDVTRVLPAQAVQHVHARVAGRAGFFELAQDGDDVRRVADGGEERAGELRGVVLE